MKWYKHDPDAALAGMSGLTLEERGAYYTVMDAFYSRDGVLPDDDFLLSKILGCQIRTWKKIKIALFKKQKIHVDGLGNLVPNRGVKTLKEARKFSENQSERSSKRWEKYKNTRNNNETPMRTRNAITTTTTSTYKKDTDSETGTESSTPSENHHLTPAMVGRTATRPADGKALFDQFWKNYPKRDGPNPKHPAQKKFLSMCKLRGVDPQEIVLSAKRYADHMTEIGKYGTQYVAQAMTWLSECRWIDYPTNTAATARSPPGWEDGLPTSEELRLRYAADGRKEMAPMDGGGDRDRTETG